MFKPFFGASQCKKPALADRRAAALAAGAKHGAKRTPQGSGDALAAQRPKKQHHK